MKRKLGLFVAIMTLLLLVCYFSEEDARKAVFKYHCHYQRSPLYLVGAIDTHVAMDGVSHYLDGDIYEGTAFYDYTECTNINRVLDDIEHLYCIEIDQEDKNTIIKAAKGKGWPTIVVSAYDATSLWTYDEGCNRGTIIAMPDSPKPTTMLYIYVTNRTEFVHDVG